MMIRTARRRKRKRNLVFREFVERKNSERESKQIEY